MIHFGKYTREHAIVRFITGGILALFSGALLLTLTIIAVSIKPESVSTKTLLILILSGVAFIIFGILLLIIGRKVKYEYLFDYDDEK